MGRLVIWALAAALFAPAAQAAPRTVAPPPAPECQRLAEVMSKKLKGAPIALTETAMPAAPAERLKATGAACLLTAAKSGLPAGFFFDTLDEPFFKGWEQVLPVAADGPDGSIMGWSKGADVVIYELDFALPEKTCGKARDLEACERKHQKQRVYKLTALAFRFTDSAPISEQDFD